MDWKAILTSRTVWLNVIAVVVEILTLAEWMPLLAPAVLPYLFLGHAVGNVLLRALGGQPFYRPRV